VEDTKMALQAKFSHIRIDDMIWNDPVMLEMKLGAFRTYVFAIAWSKAQRGRTPDGILTKHGCKNICSTPKDLQELVELKLLVELPDGAYEIVKYKQWQVLSTEEKQQSERMSEIGTIGATKRWAKPDKSEPPPVEEGFEVEKAFEEAWAEWPDAVDPKYTEKREQAYEAFRVNITNAKDFSSFSAALLKRIKEYGSEAKPKGERRKFLGAFRNFCDGRWKDWIPKSHMMYANPDAPPKVDPNDPRNDPRYAEMYHAPVEDPYAPDPVLQAILDGKSA
jgi:hypothetical protein